MVKPMSNPHKILLALLMLIAIPAYATEIQTSVDRNPVSINDSFRIIFSAGEKPDGDPDFAPLQDNFEIVDQQRSSNASWVNGRSSRVEQWTLSVLAKQTGELLIPPIAFGSDTSKPLKITVSENQAAPQSNDEIFLEVAATPEKPYVQSQVIYTLRLYRRLQITQARLDEPQMKDAVIEKLGEDSNYTTQVKGVDYWVTERKYAIFPQQSGAVTIAPLTLTADVLVQRQPRFNGFFNQQTTETRRISSKAVTLNVQAAPANFNGPWLSAEALQLSENWSDNSRQVKVGEPLTRTIRLTAKGATVGQLPELSSQTAMDGIKTYPDQPVLKEDKQSDGMTATREEKIAFIPSKPGNYTIPGLKITWYNSKTQQQEHASLPDVVIKAVGGDPLKPSVPTAPATDSPVQIQPIASVSPDSDDIRLWQGLSAFLALGWLLTIAAYLRKAKPAPTPTQPREQPVAETNLEKNLKRACWENNPHLAKQQLLQWGKTRYGVDNLGSIAKHSPDPLRQEIETLNQHLYAQQAQAWNGEPLWQAFSNHQEEKNRKTPPNDGLEPLYKL